MFDTRQIWDLILLKRSGDLRNFHFVKKHPQGFLDTHTCNLKFLFQFTDKFQNLLCLLGTGLCDNRIEVRERLPVHAVGSEESEHDGHGTAVGHGDGFHQKTQRTC